MIGAAETSRSLRVVRCCEPERHAWRRAYFSVLTVLAVAALAYRSLFGTLLARRHRYAVAATNRLDASITELRLEPNGRASEFVPGQFIFVSFRSDVTGPEPHPFSIASSPQGPTLDLVVKALGDYTTTLMAIPPGVRADVEGPYGSFSHINVPAVRQIWIAGGIGVTPFLSTARSLESSSYEIDFYYCTEGAEHAHFFDELCEIADRNPRFRVSPVRKRSLGRISASDIVGVSRPIQHSAAILICGPAQVIENLVKQLIELPDGGILKGKEGAREFAAKHAEIDGRKQAVTLTSLEARTLNRFVVALVMSNREVATDELLYSMEVGSVIEVRDGLVTHNQLFPSPEEAAAAA